MPAPINIPSATAVRTITVSGGNLFRLALDDLGDALQWNRIASSNRLLDPFLPSNMQINLIIPSVNFGASESGVLQPNIGTPVFASGGASALSSPIETSPPQIIPNAPQVGQTLTATNGIWTNSPISFAYQWKRNGAIILGASSSSYIPISADIGNTLTIAVVATNSSSGVGAPAISVPTAPVIDIIPTINTIALISGTPAVGTAITATDAIWNNSVTGRAYQWQVAGVNGTGTGAATLTYTPAAGDLGQTLTITVTATNTGGTSLPSTSAASAATGAAGGGKLDFSAGAAGTNTALIAAIGA